MTKFPMMIYIKKKLQFLSSFGIYSSQKERELKLFQNVIENESLHCGYNQVKV